MALNIDWMVTGVTSSNSGALDNFFTLLASNYNPGEHFAHIGIETDSEFNTINFWSTGSNQSTSNKNLSCYSPFPGNGGDITRLYFITSSIVNNSNVTSAMNEYSVDRNWFVNLTHDNDRVYILTPGQSNGTGGDKLVSLYSFNNVEDMWADGWRIKNNNGDSFDKTLWDNTKTDERWSTVAELDNTIDNGRIQILANMLALTPLSKTIQDAQIGGSPRDEDYIKGAIVLGTGELWSEYKYVVPFKDRNLDTE